MSWQQSWELNIATPWEEVLTRTQPVVRSVLKSTPSIEHPKCAAVQTRDVVSPTSPIVPSSPRVQHKAA